MRRLLLLVPLLACVFAITPDSIGQDAKKKKKADPAKPVLPTKPQTATDPTTLKVAKGFKVELLYTVPKDTQGSWVNLCVDPKGRLITSDQYGPLYRITPPKLGSTEGLKVERIPAPVGDAQGLLWAFDSLYVMANSRRKIDDQTALKPALYRVTSSKNDDVLDKAEMLLEFGGAGGEHGTHAILPHPDGKRLTLVCGNQTTLPKYDRTLVPPHWGEDHLLPRLPDGNGFMRGVMGPGGFMVNVDKNGKNLELHSVGFRNQYDAAYNRDGDLFTYDADMEWDMNTPWYRPTRVCFVPPGAEFGWRNGAGKYPPYYADNLGGTVNIGPGSPTGVCFGYGAKFPGKYQQAFFICDWSYGKLYAVHMKGRGTAYEGTFEEFVTGSPLPLTDVVINPTDGAMYFAIGGRRTQSGLYRVTYTGSEPTTPDETPVRYAGEEVKTRLKLEANLGSPAPELIDTAIRHLDANDDHLRFAARNTLEFADPKLWADKVLSLEPVGPTKDATARILGVLALARSTAPCPQHAKPDSPKPTAELRGKLIKALTGLKFSDLTTSDQLELLRTYQVVLNRFGPVDEAERKAILANLDNDGTTGNRYVEGERLAVLVYLKAPTVAVRGMKLLADAPTQEEQMEYARSLRVLDAGWTPALKKQYAEWFVSANGFRGGNSLRGFMKLMRDDFEKTLTPDDKVALKSTLETAAAGPKGVASGPTRAVVQKWTINDFAGKLETGLAKGRDFDRGRKLFAEARCFGCHRYDNDGSSFGPDLSGVAGRFGPKDLLESIIDPNKEVSDQYAAVTIETEDGRTITGRIVNLNGDGMNINTDMLDPNAMVNVNRNNIASLKPAKSSMMPAGLLDVLKPDEVLDLMAYLLSRGDKSHAMFGK